MDSAVRVLLGAGAVRLMSEIGVQISDKLRLRFVRKIPTNFGEVGKVIGEDLAKDPHAFWAVLDQAASTLSAWAAHLGAIF